MYRATDRQSGRKAALKILLPQVSADENIARRFQREMSILERLDHPHIVRYYEDGQHDGRLYYVMELVDAGSLKDELAIHGRLPWPQVCRYGIEICSALQYAHNHGIIHRDLKPANLFLSDDGKLKLGDFGIARDTGSADLTDAGLTVGTYAYMAPEQIRAGSNVSDQTDLYALGCLLYQMLSGRQPYEGENFAQIFEQHLNMDPPRITDRVPDCPQELEDMILRLMAKDAVARPFNARYVQGYLDELMQRYGKSAAGAAATSRAGDLAGAATAPTSYGQLSWPALGGIVLLIAGLVGAAILLSRTGP